MPAARKHSARLDDRNVPPHFLMAAFILEKTEHLTHLHLTSAKVALEKGVESASALADVRGLGELVDVRNRLAETGMQYAQAYSQDLYQVVSESQAELAVLFQSAWGTYRAAVEDWVQQCAKIVQGGSQFAIDAVRSSFAATNDTIRRATEAAQQAGAIADEAMEMVTNEPNNHGSRNRTGGNSR